MAESGAGEYMRMEMQGGASEASLPAQYGAGAEAAAAQGAPRQQGQPEYGQAQPQHGHHAPPPPAGYYAPPPPQQQQQQPAYYPPPQPAYAPAPAPAPPQQQQQAASNNNNNNNIVVVPVGGSAGAAPAPRTVIIQQIAGMETAMVFFILGFCFPPLWIVGSFYPGHWAHANKILANLEITIAMLVVIIFLGMSGGMTVNESALILAIIGFIEMIIIVAVVWSVGSVVASLRDEVRKRNQVVVV